MTLTSQLALLVALFIGEAVFPIQFLAAQTQAPTAMGSFAHATDVTSPTSFLHDFMANVQGSKPPANTLPSSATTAPASHNTPASQNAHDRFDLLPLLLTLSSDVNPLLMNMLATSHSGPSTSTSTSGAPASPFGANIDPLFWFFMNPETPLYLLPMLSNLQGGSGTSSSSSHSSNSPAKFSNLLQQMLMYRMNNNPFILNAIRNAFPTMLPFLGDNGKGMMMSDLLGRTMGVGSMGSVMAGKALDISDQAQEANLFRVLSGRQGMSNSQNMFLPLFMKNEMLG